MAPPVCAYHTTPVRRRRDARPDAIGCDRPCGSAEKGQIDRVAPRLQAMRVDDLDPHPVRLWQQCGVLEGAPRIEWTGRTIGSSAAADRGHPQRHRAAHLQRQRTVRQLGVGRPLDAQRTDLRPGRAIRRARSIAVTIASQCGCASQTEPSCSRTASMAGPTMPRCHRCPRGQTSVESPPWCAVKTKGEGDRVRGYAAQLQRVEDPSQR